ncbi:nitroreductase family protein [Paenibacillus pini]|nr:nitroreductase [Paenibacillus pini]
MKITELIKTRRNVKQFKVDPIHEDTLNSWLEAASYAPNHRMNEPWKIIFVGKETRAKLNHKTNFGNAPIVIAVLSEGSVTALQRDENVMATACFVQNFLLAAHEEGVGTYWSSMGAQPQNREILNVPENDDVIGVFGIGYPVEVPNAKPRTPITSKITYLS